MRDRKKECPVPAGAERQGNRSMRRRLLLLVAWGGVAAAGYCWGRFGTAPKVRAEPVRGGGVAGESRPASDYSRRPVAYIHETIPITREDLGEYLIARCGKQRLTNLINKRIIEHTARQKGVEISAAEVDAALVADYTQLGLRSPREFEDHLLKRYQKTIYEWKEDVIKPRLMMEKMCRSRVTVSREDVAQAYEAYFGEKVECKIIMWPKEEEHHVLHTIWPKIHNNEEEFDRAARMQASPSLAAAGGLVKPLGHNTTGDPALEKVLFSLRPGETSEVIRTREGLVVIKCLRRLPPDTTASYESRRPKLEKEVFDKKVALEIGKMFQDLKAQARPRNFLEPRDIVQEVKEELPTGKPASVAQQPLPATVKPVPGASSGALAPPVLPAPPR
jgi:hypothetical protein